MLKRLGYVSVSYYYYVMINKKRKTFATIFRKNKQVISKLYYKHIFLIIISSTLVISILLYLWDAHILMFGDNENSLGEYVKTIATVLGGALLILGLSINNKRVVEQTRRNDIAERGQLNSRFKDAATLLGGDHVSTILSGVYALHQIAEESCGEDQYQQGYVNVIHEILSAYIRENTATVENIEKGKMWRINEKPTIVIQTIMTVLFNNERSIYSSLVTDLSDCVFEDINLDDANIVGVDFSRTKFIRSSMKNANFESCYFEEVFIDDVDFTNSEFKQVIFDHSFIRNTKFINSQMNRTDFWDATLNKVNFKNAIFECVDFKDAEFDEMINFDSASLQDLSVENIKEKIA